MYVRESCHTLIRRASDQHVCPRFFVRVSERATVIQKPYYRGAYGQIALRGLDQARVRDPIRAVGLGNLVVRPGQ